MSNEKIRDYAKEKKVFLWEVAQKMNISEPTITRKLRTELSKTELSEMKMIVDEIAKSKAKKGV